jgi:hypothetical protein
MITYCDDVAKLLNCLKRAEMANEGRMAQEMAKLLNFGANLTILGKSGMIMTYALN